MPGARHGHPPFGHNGEMALADLAAGCGGFEGNAQTLRLLTRLETKVAGAGLNLTRASLDATLKYPWPAPPRGATAPSVGAVPAPPKFNYYADDAAVFDWIRLGPRPAAAAWRPRLWTGPTTWPIRCTTWRTACTPG